MNPLVGMGTDKKPKSRILNREIIHAPIKRKKGRQKRELHKSSQRVI